jgi:hypothetical protein
MKLKTMLYGLVIVICAQSLTACVPIVVGAAAGAAGAYVYDKNYSASNQ